MPDSLDTLPQWLYQRLGRRGAPWNALSPEDQAYWAHEAAAVRRAVERGGFKSYRRYVYVGRFHDIHREDQDINAWVEQIPDRQDVEHEVWVQVHSADDHSNHVELEQMAGARVRVTIELLDG